jgi:hypothetical protein
LVAILSSLELKTVLSLIETSNAETDVKQRAWMLRSLIAHVNTDSVITPIIYLIFRFLYNIGFYMTILNLQ